MTSGLKGEEMSSAMELVMKSVTTEGGGVRNNTNLRAVNYG
jgi:hypothetical protein